MAEILDDIKIDLDALDRENAEKDAAKAKKSPDAPIVEVTDAKPAEKPAKPIVKPEEGLEKLQKQLAEEKQRTEDERAGREAAEKRAADAKKSEVAAKSESQTNQLHLITTAIENVTQSNDILETRYAESLAAQDYAGASKINREMQKNSAKLIQLESGKQMLEKQPPPTIPAETDIVEDFCSRLTPKSASWVRAHSEYVKNPVKNRKMLAAHELATADGIKADTPEYFEAIEKTLGLSTAVPIIPDDEIEVDPMADSAKPTRSTPPAGAPVSRSGNGAGGRPNVITLTAEEVEMAKNMDMSPEEYARQKLSLKREGKLNS